ncbi:DUF6973 domain-containing protein [Planktosalinus lacus]|uniref:DUF6973 domain-containing protein n=1 Tax=Planktosalinus lacus TaxID=1526573 RepID=A0A8J2VAI0_9FLAO|nr:hypothetical protein [Planktosalinus lacus]GGD94732.1 hypothetical protein GCM10011312_18020 [Planktosalinus lacus]
MAVWNRIKNLNFKQFFSLAGTFMKRPTYFFPTHRATLKTVQICDRLFKKAHHKNNVTNAFRHALWNVLIAKKCFAKNDSVEKSVEWAKTITDLHEKLAPNDELEMSMDLHNNEIGRKLFAEKQMQNMEEESIIAVLKEKMQTAVKVSSIEEIKGNKSEFVYIEDLIT